MSASFNPSSTTTSSTLTLTASGTATTGTVTVIVTGTSGSLTNSAAISLTVQAVTVSTVPAVWSDGDVGSVGLAGSASFANGTFTVKGAGQQIWGTADAMNFVYQSLSGDGTMVARVVSLQGGSGYTSAGVMIRETLNAGATNAYPAYWGSYGTLYFATRTSTGGGTTSIGSLGGVSLPYWVKVVRSGSSFSSYSSTDGVNWVPLGSSQTLSMAQTVYVGLAVNSGSSSALATATFDNVSLSTPSAPAPAITSVSATSGSVGSPVVISGTGFGASQGASMMLLNGAPVSSSWSSTSINITIPSGATSGPLVVSVAPSMNDSNPVMFTVSTQPLPSGWLDQDIGSVGAAGSAGYGNGTFTVKGAGQQIWGTADALHFVYQPLSGDGTIVARVVSLQGGSGYTSAGVMIRETLNAGATNANMVDWTSYATIYFDERASTGGSTTTAGSLGAALPRWVKVVRSGSTFSSYSSTDGVTWVQLGTSQTLSMAQTVYVGLVVNSGSTPALATATFDNVSVTSP